jgi:phage tail sheath protein FI
MPVTYFSPGVYVEEVDKGPKPIEGVGTAVAAFIGFAEKGPVGEPTRITNWTQFTTEFGGFIKDGFLAPAVYGYFNNGGTDCYITRLPGEITTNGQANGRADGRATAALPAPSAVLPSRGGAAVPTLELTALDAGTAAGPGIAVEVRAPDEGAPDDQFTVVVRGGGTEETFGGLSLGRSRGARNAVDTINRESKLVRALDREAPGSLAERAPAINTYTLTAAQPAASLATHEATALAIPEVDATAFIGDAAERTGIMGYEVADDVTMLCVPDLMAAYLAGRITEEQVRAVQTAMMDHCAAMKYRVAIIDCPPDMKPQRIRDWRMNVANYDSSYAALYYPWIRVANPLGGDSNLVPPSGHMAGVWARSDGERGVHKAPANEVIRGVIGLERQITRNEQDSLNPVGINCLRAFPGRGIRVWGARTLTNDPAWKYLNVRRLFNFVENSIEVSTQWVVFEPNDLDLWERIKRDVGAFLTRVWNSGALFGDSPNQAFYVKCDEELNPPEVRDVGQLIIEVGLAPVKPAEFVIFRISQFSGSPEA